MANIQEANIIITLYYVALNVVTIMLVFWYYKIVFKKRNTFAVPLIFLVSPVVFYYELASMRSFVHITSCPAGWEVWGTLLALIYSFPFFIATSTISIVLFIRRKKHTEKQNGQG